jgi:type IV pilus assembly protein PilC
MVAVRAQTQEGVRKGKGGGALSITIPFLGSSVKPKELMLFTRQLATLIDAGLPLVRSLNVLRDQARPGVLKTTLSNLVEEVEGGSTFSEALAKFPGIFTKLFVNMIRAGEIGGVLEVVLTRLAEFAESSQKLAGRVKSALIYPSFVITFAITIVMLLLTFVVPKFTEIFKDLNTRLPTLTEILIKISDSLKNKWYVGIGVVIFAVIAFRLLSKIPQVKYIQDAGKLQIPIFGPLLRKVGVSRFARTLGTLITSGVPILQALQIVRDTAGNEVVAKAIGQVHDSIREGESIAKPLEKSKVFPLFVVNMIDVGEETGALDQMLMKVADAYDEDINATIAALTSLLEPLLIITMGLIVGFIVIALFLPLIGLIQTMSGGGEGGTGGGAAGGG